MKQDNQISPVLEENKPLRLFRTFALAMLLLILVFVVFSNTLANDFVFDDSSMIKNNPAIRSPRYVKLYFIRPFFSVGQPVTGPVDYDYYRPLVLVSYLLDYLLWNGSPGGYHLTNIVLQSISAILFFLVLCRLNVAAPVSFFAAVLFAVHPAIADSVAGVSGRSDPLCALFLLSAFYCFLMMKQASQRAKRVWLAGLSLCYLSALMTKENAIAFPFLLGAYELLKPNPARSEKSLRDTLNTLLPSFTIAVAYFLWRNTVINSSFSLRERGELLQRSATSAVVAAEYLLMAFVPGNLYFERFTRQVETVLSPRAVVSVAVLLILFLAALFLRKRHAHMSFFILWFFIFLLPFSYFFLFVPESIFFTPPHFLYFPLMGLTAAAALAGNHVRGYLRGRRQSSLFLACGALIPCLLAVQTIGRNGDWRDEFTFFSKMLRHDPLNARTYIGMGNTLLARGQMGHALARYAQAYELSDPLRNERAGPFPDGAKEGMIAISNYHAAAASAGMGDAYFALGEPENAVEMYLAALEQNAFNSVIHYKLGRAYEYIGSLEKALASYDRALRLDKNLSGARASREIILLKKEVYDQAKRVYLTSHLSGREKSADAYYGEAIMIRLSGKGEVAEALLREAVKEDPFHFGANLALGQILSERGANEEALGNFSIAYASVPTSAVAAKELALTSLVLKDTLGAVRWAAKAYELAPDQYYEQFLWDVQRLSAPAKKTAS
ncbi:MAG: tetratricopeptide repeat protein [Candidatus Abyssobacteria bacterium SURF_5]|uniref:Tetratricopeptide repeat protein n=1 Tax=Abyssobacteria bacterium (strain SURF_5) TaxID=2093360 RepID=A0A3A4N590_ABYX5|nr:MAG: tetratricopeptide repeat protein [Candidatus Abyssubacteria bacterium SURF_5]